jgi:uncharacterized Fe-S center protein
MDPAPVIFTGKSLIPASILKLVTTSAAVKFLKKRMHFLRKLDKRPVFIHRNCTGCSEFIKICPANAITMHPVKTNWVVLTDKRCIRCFCCSEVCQHHAVEIRKKFFGD